MVAPLSDDLKERIVSWYLEDGLTMEQVAERARCSVGLVSKVIKIYRETGRVSNPVQRSGRPRILTEADLNFIGSLLDAQPTIFLDELQHRLKSVRDVGISISALCRALLEHELTRKKVTKEAAERDEELRMLWLMALAEYTDPNLFVFLDESAVDDKTIQRQHGRSRLGTPCIARYTFLRGTRYSVLPALSLRGIEALKIVEGSITKERFLDFLEKDVCPFLNPYPQERSVVVMDNCAIHHDEDIRKLIVEECGARLIYLPPYSPDLNPIEEAFSALKAALRRMEHMYQSEEQMPWLISQAIMSITADDAYGWFHDCGYL